MKTTCDQCHGTGQVCYFKGESRFLLSRDECPVCCGLGYIETEEKPCDEQRAGEDRPPMGST